MKNRILSYLLGWLFAVLFSFWWLWQISVNAEMICDAEGNCYEEVPLDAAVVTAEEWTTWWGCNWIKLNTNFPIIWNCIWDDADEDPTNVFPTMTWALAKIIVSLILVVCFILIIVAWILWAANKPDKARPLLKNVAITILLLWFSWAILRLILPNFFGAST